MAFWSNWFGTSTADVVPNGNPSSSVGPDYNPGDPDGFELLEPEQGERYALPFPVASSWSGYPAEWATPPWQQSGMPNLVDTAWDCIDLNSSILSTMPIYRLRNGVSIGPTSWMKNPDPDVYTSWEEFAKQLFWEFQMGEVFILASDYYATGWPSRFRVMPSWAFTVEMAGGRRQYKIGSVDVTGQVLHIRYKSTVDQARGIGPLEAAGARLTTAGVLQRQMDDVARSGGVPPYILEIARRLTKTESDEVLTMWMDSRQKFAGAPAIASGGTVAKAMQVPSPKDMALLELSQFTEGRIAVKLGVPPFLVGLPSGGDPMTYSNVSQLFDFHDRASLKTKAVHVMKALSWWTLPPDESVELNRDEYTRPALPERAKAYVDLHGIGALSSEEIRVMERFVGDEAAGSLTGSDATTGTGGSSQANRTAQKQRDVAETIQKVYLGVGKIVTSDEARQIVNRAGANLTVPGPKFPTPQQGGDQGE